jgi:hypothetical protein
MDLTWVDAAQPVVAGLAGILGVHGLEEALGALRRRGLCPERWCQDRLKLRRRDEPVSNAVGS